MQGHKQSWAELKAENKTLKTKIDELSRALKAANRHPIGYALDRWIAIPLHEKQEQFVGSILKKDSITTTTRHRRTGIVITRKSTKVTFCRNIAVILSGIRWTRRAITFHPCVCGDLSQFNYYLALKPSDSRSRQPKETRDETV